MFDYSVKKMIAKESERIIVESSYEEMLNFTEARIRPDFDDDNIICIKFLISTTEEDNEPEHTKWHINPYYFKGEGRQFEYNLTMPYDFVPEILLIDVPTVYVINKFRGFNSVLPREIDYEPNDEEKYALFLKKCGKAIKGYIRHHSN